MLHAKISRGDHKGKLLTPHKHKDGMYVATTSRYEDDYIRVESIEELIALVKSGYGARLSNNTTGNAPSYIVNNKLILDGVDENHDEINTKAKIQEAFFNAELDSETRSKYRKEQSLLRALLLGDSKTGVCTICQKEFPFDFLIAAHLKMRSECTLCEKKDLENIATLMCKSGCDDLYEKGYISVQDGMILKNKKITTPSIDDLISKIVDNEITNWSGSSSYYDWQYKKLSIKFELRQS